MRIEPRNASEYLSLIGACVASLLLIAIASDHTPLGCEDGNACIGSIAFWASWVICPIAALFPFAAIVAAISQAKQDPTRLLVDFGWAIGSFAFIAVMGALAWFDPLYDRWTNCIALIAIGTAHRLVALNGSTTGRRR